MAIILANLSQRVDGQLIARGDEGEEGKADEAPGATA